MKIRTTTMLGSLCAGAMLAFAAPACAQSYDDDVVITGPYYNGDEPSLSVRVSYADLDIGTNWGFAELRARIADAARDVCRELRDIDSAPSMTMECEDQAMRSALNRVGTPRAHDAPRRTAWLASR